MSSVKIEIVEWNLDSLVDGGEDGIYGLIDQAADKVEETKQFLKESQLRSALMSWQAVRSMLKQGFSYVACLGIQDPKNFRLPSYQQKFLLLESSLDQLTLAIEELLADMEDKDFSNWLRKEMGKETHSSLEVMRSKAKRRLGPREESLIRGLARQGFYPISDLYNRLASKISVWVEGINFPLSILQAQELIRDPSPDVRDAVLLGLEDAFDRQGEIFCHLINQVTGFRLEVNKQRNWVDPLEETLITYGVSKESVNAMWRQVNEHKAPFIVFLKQRAEIDGREKPAWSDILGWLLQEKNTPLEYKYAVSWVGSALSDLDPQASHFFKKMLKSNWVSTRGIEEGVVSSFTLPFPLSREVRTFLGYSNGIEKLLDFSRQIAMGYKHTQMMMLPELSQNSSPIVNEAYGIFVERLTLDVVSARAFTRQQYFDALFSHLQKAVMSVLDMQSRYIFEDQLYSERLRGLVGVRKLCELMQQAQKIAYSNQLSRTHKYYWAAKPHFFSTKLPFQNYPLTMGYLLGCKIYQEYKSKGSGFAKRVVEWAIESGQSANLEEVTLRNLGIDLSKDETWSSAMEQIEQDVRVLGDLIDVKDKTFGIESKAH